MNEIKRKLNTVDFYFFELKVNLIIVAVDSENQNNYLIKINFDKILAPR